MIQITHSRNDLHAQVQWQASRAICDDPNDEPCEWVGAQGEATQAVVSAGSLIAVLPISADADNPFLLHLAPPKPGRVAQGVLLSAQGDLLYRLQAERSE